MKLDATWKIIGIGAVNAAVFWYGMPFLAGYLLGIDGMEGGNLILFGIIGVTLLLLAAYTSYGGIKSIIIEAPALLGIFRIGAVFGWLAIAAVGILFVLSITWELWELTIIDILFISNGVLMLLVNLFAYSRSVDEWHVLHSEMVQDEEEEIPDYMENEDMAALEEINNVLSGE